MLNSRRKRFLIVFIITIISVILMVYSILPTSIVNKSTTPLSFIITPVERFVSSIRHDVKNYFQVARQNAEYEKTIEELKNQNVELRLKIKENEVAAIEYDELKDVYNLSNRYNYAEFVAARVLQKPLNLDSGLYRIDRGSQEGINLEEKEGFPVINSEGKVFGRIYNVDELSAKVLPLIHEGFSVSCFAENNRGQTFVLRGDEKFKSESLCILDEIPKTAVLKVDDVIYTSGLGGIFPYGFELGKIVELLPVDEEGFRQAVVEPSIPLNETEIVFVMFGNEIIEQPSIEEESN